MLVAAFRYSFTNNRVSIANLAALDECYRKVQPMEGAHRAVEAIGLTASESICPYQKVSDEAGDGIFRLLEILNEPN